MSLSPTYKIERGPAPLEFAEYATTALRAWQDLLSQDPDEPHLQRFLEANPAFVPGSRSPGAATSASPLLNILISQPTLPGFDARRPDFLWFTSTSDTWYPVLIEIERPSKRIFRSDGVPTAQFTQARNQLNQWRSWLRQPANQIKLQQDYGVPDLWTHRRAMSFHMILIYGRRCEFELDPRLSKQRASLLPGHDEELMSLDRLTPDPFLSDAITTRAVGSGRYKALKVPPTFTFTPDHAERLLFITDLPKAIDSSQGWSPERRTFIQRRVPYWVDWARRSGKGWITAGDRE